MPGDAVAGTKPEVVCAACRGVGAADTIRLLVRGPVGIRGRSTTPAASPMGDAAVGRASQLRVRWRGRMRRAFAAATMAALLISMLPAVASGAPITRFSHHSVAAFCDSPVDGGYLFAGINSDTEFGQEAFAQAWLEPAAQFEDPPTARGESTSVAVEEGASEVVLSATFTAFDGDGDELGEATLIATMTRVGDPVPLEPPPRSNHHWAGSGTFQSLEGTGTFTWPGGALTAECFGEILDETVVEANPTSFVFRNSEVGLDCFWETADAFAGLFLSADRSGLSGDVFEVTANQSLFTIGEVTGAVDASSASATAALVDEANGDRFTATAEATLAPIGDPVTSLIVEANRRVKLTEQALAAQGILNISNGDSFPIDSEHCTASIFDVKEIQTGARGPRTGATPPNDTPEGADVLTVGSRLNRQTTGAAAEPEAFLSCAPIGRTVWYQLVGTGDPVTLSTAGSNFDTIIAAFTSDGKTFTEIECNDDVELPTGGFTRQAAITIDTEPGETYWIEVGGFPTFLTGDFEVGRLRLAVT
jgi:hypothetical protein